LVWLRTRTFGWFGWFALCTRWIAHTHHTAVRSAVTVHYACRYTWITVRVARLDTFFQLLVDQLPSCGSLPLRLLYRRCRLRLPLQLLTRLVHLAFGYTTPRLVRAVAVATVTRLYVTIYWLRHGHAAAVTVHTRSGPVHGWTACLVPALDYHRYVRACLRTVRTFPYVPFAVLRLIRYRCGLPPACLFYTLPLYGYTVLRLRWTHVRFLPDTHRVYRILVRAAFALPVTGYVPQFLRLRHTALRFTCVAGCYSSRTGSHCLPRFMPLLHYSLPFTHTATVTHGLVCLHHALRAVAVGYVTVYTFVADYLYGWLPVAITVTPRSFALRDCVTRLPVGLPTVADLTLLPPIHRLRVTRYGYVYGYTLPFHTASAAATACGYAYHGCGLVTPAVLPALRLRAYTHTAVLAVLGCGSATCLCWLRAHTCYTLRTRFSSPTTTAPDAAGSARFSAAVTFACPARRAG